MRFALTATGLLCLAGTAATAQVDDIDASPDVPDEVLITAGRVPQPISSIPALVTVIDEQALDDQRLIADDLQGLLANLMPGFAPSRQKLSGFGESFRGRSPLYLIDGVPQSNPLRDGSRDGYTIDLSVIERIEVINGANAIQGLGATGGIVNYVTKRADPSGELTIGGEAAVTAADGFDDNGFAWRGSLNAAQQLRDVDVIAAVSYAKRGLFYDGDGRPIAVDTTQGDLADSQQLNLFAKAGWEPTADQRLQLTVNRFRLDGDGDFQTQPGDRAAGLPATAIPGAPPGAPAENGVWTASLDYSHENILGARFAGQVYYQDFEAIFGGGVFGVFQDPAVAPVGTLFEQSANRSEKVGARSTLAWSDVGTAGFDIIGGIDLLRDRTEQALIETGRTWVPETDYRNAAPFLQADWAALPWLRLAGGVRYEIAELDVGDYVSIAGNRDDFARTEVDGGSPSFDDALVNGAVIVEPGAGLSFYGSYSEGYTVPDVGRVLRGVGEPGTDIDSLFALSPIVAENWEAGATVSRDGLTLQLAYYVSDSDEGSRLVADADGILRVRREKTRIEGYEASVEAEPTDGLRLGGNLSVISGRTDSDGDGRLDADLDAVNVGTDRLNLYAAYVAGPASVRLQSATLFDRDFEDAAEALAAEFEGYTLVDLLGSYDTPVGRISLGIQNLTDEQYITYFGQAGTTRDDRFSAGRGRTFTVGIDTAF
ncbi:MAG: TonB-dependent receptor [Pacificimonas sp.]